MRYQLLRIISGKGNAPHQFARTLRGITIGPEDLIYTVGDSDVKVFDIEGTLQRQWRTGKPGYCIAIDLKKIIYVGQEGRIERFRLDGKPHDVWKDVDRFGFVTAIDFNRTETFVADAKDRCLRRYGENGKWLNDIGKDNNTKGFLIPNGHLDFAIDRQGVIHASNSAKHRVEQYAVTGEVLGRWGCFGMQQPADFPGCCNPTNLTLDKAGRTIVTEKAGPRVKVYDTKNQLLSVIDGSYFDPNVKNMDVAVDSQERIYVIDTVRLHICVFEPIGTQSQPAGEGGKAP